MKAQEARIGRQLYLEDVDVGTELEPVEVGPLRIDQFARYCMAGGVPAPGQDLGAIHYDPWFAAASGLKDVVDMGAWRTALFIQYGQVWAGPHGRVRRILNRYREFVYRGETLVFRARVVGKREVDGGGEIDLEIWNDTGDGQPVTTGEMTLVVPRGAGR